MKPKKSEINGVLRADKFVDRLLTEGSRIGCNECHMGKNSELPPFYDEKLYKKGQEVFNKHFFAMFYAKINGLLAILAVPSILKILMFTQKSSSNYTAYVRYMSTIFHMLVWYRDDLTPGSKLWKSLTEVNKKHSSASKKSCSAGLNMITQSDMALTQFGFMGFQLARSEKVGIYATEEELRAFIHVWRVVGYLMGLEDRFNICSSSVEETKEICNRLIDRCLRPAVSDRNPNFLDMSSYLIGGMWSMSPFLYHKIMMNHLYILLQEPENNNNNNNDKSSVKEYFRLNFIMSLRFYFISLTMYLLRYNIFRNIYNSLHHLNIWFMENWPILVYYSFGNVPDAIVKIKV